MKSIQTNLSVKWVQVFCAVGILYAVVVTAYLFMATGQPSGARDFHQFWYAGHFIHQGRDPYQAYFVGEKPTLPIHYVDGVTVDRYPVAQPDLEYTPSNTPAILLTLTPFSYFSWNSAKWIFLMINILLMLMTGWLALWHIPFGGIKLPRLETLMVFLIYFGFSATRIAIENGQTTLLVFLLMMVSLIFSKRAWYVSGLALGLALSKYSLSIPIFLFFLYKKNYKVLLLAASVQLAGILGLSAISGAAPLKLMQENIMLFLRLFDQPGVQLSRSVESVSRNPYLTILPSLVMTALVFIPSFLWLRRTPPRTVEQEEIQDFHVLTILFLWTLLVAYHRLYDTLILIFFVILIFKGLARQEIWDPSSRGRYLLFAFVVVLMPLILILPARIVDLWLPFYYGRVSDFITTVLLVVMLILSMFLLWRYLQNIQIKTIHKETDSHELRNDPHRDTRPRWAHHS